MDMAEETLNQGEGETLNSEAETKTTYTAEEVEAMKKELSSNSERGVQKVISEKKALEMTLDEIGKVAEDPAYLVSLHDSKPEVARIILNKYYDGKDIEDFKESIGYQVDFSDPETVKKHIEREAERKIQYKITEDAKSEFIKRLGIEGDELKAFEGAFDERKQLKSFNSTDIQKHLEKAYREIADENQIAKLKNQETIANVMATGEGGSKSGNDQKKADPLKGEISSFLSKFS